MGQPIRLRALRIDDCPVNSENYKKPDNFFCFRKLHEDYRAHERTKTAAYRRQWQELVELGVLERRDRAARYPSRRPPPRFVGVGFIWSAARFCRDMAGMSRPPVARLPVRRRGRRYGVRAAHEAADL